MENNNILNDVEVDDEDSVPDDDEEDVDDDESGDEEEEINVAHRHDGVLEGNVAEPLESGKARRLAADADIVRVCDFVSATTFSVCVVRKSNFCSLSSSCIRAAQRNH